MIVPVTLLKFSFQGWSPETSAKASGRIAFTKELAMPKESGLGQVGLRRPICPKSAVFSVDDRYLAAGTSDSMMVIPLLPLA